MTNVVPYLFTLAVAIIFACALVPRTSWRRLNTPATWSVIGATVGYLGGIVSLASLVAVAVLRLTPWQSIAIIIATPYREWQNRRATRRTMALRRAGSPLVDDAFPTRIDCDWNDDERNIHRLVRDASGRMDLAPYTMSAEEREEHRRSFAYGNAAISNPSVTRESIDHAAEQMAALAREAALPPVLFDDEPTVPGGAA